MSYFLGKILSRSALVALVAVFAVPAAAGTERVPYIYKVSGQECLVPVTVKYRSLRHRNYAVERIYASFSELALEREKSEPLPTAGWSPALYDLFFLHIAGDCENRLAWAKTLIDDYHGRFPDDAQLELSPGRTIPEDYFNAHMFIRIEPVYRVADCRVSVRNTGAEVHPSELSPTLIAARRDVYILTGDRNPDIYFEAGAQPNEFMFVYLDLCENRGEHIKLIVRRAMEISPEFRLEFRVVPATEARTDGIAKNAAFRDTREGLQDYLPPRHDVK